MGLWLVVVMVQLIWALSAKSGWTTHVPPLVHLDSSWDIAVCSERKRRLMSLLVIGSRLTAIGKKVNAWEGPPNFDPSGEKLWGSSSWLAGSMSYPNPRVALNFASSFFLCHASLTIAPWTFYSSCSTPYPPSKFNGSADLTAYSSTVTTCSDLRSGMAKIECGMGTVFHSYIDIWLWRRCGSAVVLDWCRWADFVDCIVTVFCTCTSVEASDAEHQLSADDLIILWGKVGVQVCETATSMFEKLKKTLIGDGAYAGFVQAAVATAPNATAAVPITSGDYGYVVYVQNRASMQRQVSEMMPGDIVEIHDAKFTNVDVNASELYAAWSAAILGSTFDWYQKFSEEATVGTGVESKGIAGGSCLQTAASAEPQKLYTANVVATLGSTGGQFQEVGSWVEQLLWDIWTAKVSRKAAVVRCFLDWNKQKNSQRLWS